MNVRGLRRDDIIYPAIFVVIFLIALRYYLVSPPYTLGDTTILPQSNPGLYFPFAIIQYYMSLMLGENNFVKLLNFIAFIIGPISIYFTLGRKNDVIKSLILPLIFTLNPFAISIFYAGDGESILLVYSLQPLVFYLTYKMLTERKPIKYFIYLSIVEVIGQIFFFQMFLFSFFFQLPLILLSIREKKYFFFIYPILADLIGFLSEASQEIGLYIGVVPTVLVSPANTLTKLGLAYYSTVVSALLLAIAITTIFVYKNKYALALMTSVGFLLLIYAYLQNFVNENIPIISALLATITTFQTKVYLLSFGLVDLSLFYLRKTREIIIPLLLLILIVLLPNTGGLEASTYSFFSFKPQPIPTWYYELYDFLSQNGPGNVFSTTSQYPYFQYLPGFGGCLSDTDVHNLTSNPFYGAKFILSSFQLNSPSLKLVKTFGPILVYYNQNYTGLVHYLNGTPVSNYSISKGEIIVSVPKGNLPVIVSLPYSKFWTNAENYNGFLELTSTISYNWLAELEYKLFFVSLLFFILPFVMLLLEKTPMKDLIVGR